MDLLGSTLKEGETIISSSSVSLDQKVRVRLFIYNFCELNLVEPTTFSHRGKISCPAVLVESGKKEMMVTHKTPYSLYGTDGTVSWKISPTKRIIVMWFAPNGFSKQENELAIGIIGVDEDDNSTHWFEKMHAKDGKGPFTQAKFGPTSQSQTMKYDDEEFCVQALIGMSHYADATISVFPQKVEHLAENMKKTRQVDLDNINQMILPE